MIYICIYERKRRKRYKNDDNQLIRELYTDINYIKQHEYSNTADNIKEIRSP